MDFALTEEQQAIFDMARDFGAEHIAPHARAWEDAGTIPRKLWARAAELGFGGLYVNEDFGGDLLLNDVQARVLAVLRMAEALSCKYHVVVANPPYMGGRGVNGKLKNFLRDAFTACIPQVACRLR